MATSLDCVASGTGEETGDEVGRSLAVGVETRDGWRGALLGVGVDVPVPNGDELTGPADIGVGALTLPSL